MNRSDTSSSSSWSAPSQLRQTPGDRDRPLLLRRTSCFRSPTRRGRLKSIPDSDRCHPSCHCKACWLRKRKTKICNWRQTPRPSMPGKEMPIVPLACWPPQVSISDYMPLHVKDELLEPTSSSVCDLSGPENRAGLRVIVRKEAHYPLRRRVPNQPRDKISRRGCLDRW